MPTHFGVDYYNVDRTFAFTPQSGRLHMNVRTFYYQMVGWLFGRKVQRLPVDSNSCNSAVVGVSRYAKKNWPKKSAEEGSSGTQPPPNSPSSSPLHPFWVITSPPPHEPFHPFIHLLASHPLAISSRSSWAQPPVKLYGNRQWYSTQPTTQHKRQWTSRCRHHGWS